jgi:hypothetical protein
MAFQLMSRVGASSLSPTLRRSLTAFTLGAPAASGGSIAMIWSEHGSPLGEFIPGLCDPRNLERQLQKLSFNKSEQRRDYHTTSSMRAPSTSLMGINNTSNIPSTYFQKPSLPANTIIRFVPQQTAWIVERMGKFNRILQPGLAILWPFLDRIAYVKSLKEAAIEIPSQSAITADNVTLELDGVLYTRVFDAYKAR